MTNAQSDLSARKSDHIDLTLGSDVGYRKTTLLEQVELMHCSLPELAEEEIDLRTRVLGKTLRAPLVITGMTGGNERAGAFNAGLAEVAERGGYALGVGSQRPMVRKGVIDEEIRKTYEIRKYAPNALLFGNIGVVQATHMTTAQVAEMVHSIGADALCVHLNPAQEMIQPGGDRDFRGALDAIARLVAELDVPVVVKETGAGISGNVGRALRSRGVRNIDVSGAGGTSWVAVEALRSEGREKALGERFWDWGLPTAASLLQVAPLEFELVISSGGLTSGLCVARSLALGATLGGFARPVIKALDSRGVAGALEFLAQVELELRTALLLTGSRTPRGLRDVERFYGPDLLRYLPKRSVL